MTKHLLFLPSSINGRKQGNLFGVVKEQKCGTTSTACYYVLDIKSAHSSRVSQKQENDHVLLGECLHDRGSLTLKLFTVNTSKTISIRVVNDNFHVAPFSSNVVEQEDSIVIIVYDDEVFKHSELLTAKDDFINDNDHFQVLAALLRNPEKGGSTRFWSCLKLLCTILHSLVNIFLYIVSIAKPVFRYSALGSHLHSFLNSLSWAILSVKRDRKVSLKVGNYILATAVDITAGVLLLHFIVYVGITTPMSDYLLHIAKEVVYSLQYLLQWLSGSPAGLKLNGPFNLMMGRFFMYHIKLWWIFLSVAQPVLELLFSIFLFLGRLGVTFQAVILEDLLALVSFHIYCIYVYAARVYYLQLSGLQAFWRLFLGRKHNPLRERVDSCHYSPDQLFVGTIAFTILLFLLPTTLMYYVVFTTMRLFLLCLSGILTQACFVFHALPLFSTIHWLCRSNKVCRSVYVTPKADTQNGSVVLFVTPVPDSLWKTVKCCLPDPVICPPSVQLGQLVHKLMVGELVYPV